MEKRYVVPEGMLKAATGAMCEADPGMVQHRVIYLGVEAVIRWLAENAPIPTDSQAIDIYRACHDATTMGVYEVKAICSMWVREMFLAPEPEVPEAIKDMQSIHLASLRDQADLDHHLLKLLTVAYQLGKASK